MMAGLDTLFKLNPGLRPRLACEIRPEGVIAARAASTPKRGDKSGAGEPVVAFAALPEGALTPGLKVPNLANRPAIVAAMGEVLEAVSPRDRALTLVVPDAAARVVLLDFDTLPPHRQEALSVVRFRLRKMVPFDVETAAVSYQTMAHRKDEIGVLVTVMPGEVLAEYEAAAREAGYEPGAVLPSTLAAVAALGGEGAPLVVNHSQQSVTTAVTQGDELLLHRSIDLPAEEDARDEELARAVITTLAWYEDTLHAVPAAIGYAGPGGAETAARSRWLRFVDRAPDIEDLVAAPATGTMTSIPAGVTAGVMGALAS
jgi:type IV pilus assembly protein PilM